MENERTPREGAGSRTPRAAGAVRAARWAAPLLVAAALGGCTGTAPAGEGPGASRAPAAPPSPAPSPATAFVREGLVGIAPAQPYRVEVVAVERHADRTVLRLDIMTTMSESAGGGGAFGTGWSPSDFSDFRLLDPVGKKIYHTLRDSGGEAFGTRRRSAHDAFEPGVHYPVQVYFPPLPPGVERLTVLAAGAVGEITGVPVVDGVPRTAPTPSGPQAPETPGAVVTLPVVEPSGDVWSHSDDLQEYVETPQRSKTRDGREETIALRADVLFAFDEADLSPKAAAVLDEVAEETRRRADPAKPPITIEGHTDARGGAGYNRALSVRRARAVERYLAARLGTDYAYRSTGKGETEPIAANEVDGRDHPAGRARNRRVEISYRIRQETPGPAASPGPPAGTGTGRVHPPAPFRPGSGPVAGSFDVGVRGGGRLRVDVHPYYRDGAYLVAVFDVTAVGADLPYPLNPFETPYGHAFLQGAPFGAVTAVDPATRTRYFALRDRGNQWFAHSRMVPLEEGRTSRWYTYLPAPPDGVTGLTFEMEGVGRVDGVPIA
ncbi:OmpA family protein [Planomonospora corallina]|uniref:OmpA family protein n=1 Tax=Planomonospora corallina TaxID=1806052 RepID=UPI00366DD777